MQLLCLRSPAAVPYPPRFRFCRIERIRAMGDHIPAKFPEILSEEDLKNYPEPLSPPLPTLSKPIELSRAMAASSRSSSFTISRNDVIFEDQWLMAVNKPAGVYCENVLSSIATLFTNSTESGGTGASRLELHLANRLDRDTSGLMLITKSHKVAAKLVKAFTEHNVRKTYIAHCVGLAPKWKKTTIKSGHGRSKHGVWRVYAASDAGKKLPGGSVVKDMETTIEVLSMNGKEMSSESSSEGVLVVEGRSVVGVDSADREKDEVLVRARPRSGRTHQIRLHCQYLGIPIVGDVKYEGVFEWKGEIYQGHELHAESISFEHPITGLPVMFRAPFPSWASDHQELP